MPCWRPKPSNSWNKIMNLGKLLGAGKSIIGGGQACRLSHGQALLPAASLFRRKILLRIRCAAGADGIAETAAAGCCRCSGQKIRAVIGQDTKNAGVCRPRRRARATTWVSKLNPAAIFRGAPSYAGKIATAVQVELSLEKVKVVHNDLTDADVEIVPMKSRPAREPAADLPPAKKSWSNLGGRIMKATAL